MSTIIRFIIRCDDDIAEGLMKSQPQNRGFSYVCTVKISMENILGQDSEFLTFKEIENTMTTKI